MEDPINHSLSQLMIRHRKTLSLHHSLSLLTSHHKQMEDPMDLRDTMGSTQSRTVRPRKTLNMTPSFHSEVLTI